MAIGAVSVSTYSGYSGKECSSCSESPHASQAGSEPGSRAPGTPQSSNKATQLTPEQKQQVAELKQRDRDVKAHEAAHVAAGGGFVRGGAKFSYQSGPDGKRYAVGGEVSIDTSPVKDNPSATIAKMQTVRSAALAPANPSGQDRSVAAAASAQEAQARKALAAENSEKVQGGGETGKPGLKNGETLHPAYNARGIRRTEDVTVSSQVDLSA